MTRAQRWFADYTKRWAGRPATPPKDWLPPAPSWLRGDTRLAPVREGAETLWRDGVPAWAWVLQATERIWAPGNGADGGEVLWSDDPFVERFPQALEGVCERYWALKRNQDTGAPGLRDLARFTHDENRPFTRQLFPTLFCGGRIVWHATILFYREHLPLERLVYASVPIVRVPSGSPPLVMIPPLPFWPKEMVASWSEGGPPT